MEPGDLDYDNALLVLVKLLALRNGSDTITINFAEQQEIMRASERAGWGFITPSISTWYDDLDIIVQLEYPDVRNS
jgi:hypothetical protein